MTVEILARIQFAMSVTFHIIWPTFNVGLIWFLLICEIAWLRTKNPDYAKLYHFWAKIFAFSFSMGVVTGIVMSYQLGLTMSAFSEFAAPVLAPLLGTEVLTAFFLEAIFIGIMLFGWGKVSPTLHLISTIAVLIGVHNSVFWILAVISWMHTPSGIVVENGKLFVTSLYDVIFSSSFYSRFIHTLLSCYFTALFVLLGVSSYYILQGKYIEIVKKAYKIVLISSAFVLLPIAWFGHEGGIEMHHHKPIALAAIEGLWDTQKGAPTVLFAIPSISERRNYFEIAIPYGSSLMTTHSLYGEVKGLNDFPEELWPKIIPMFFAFRIMVGMWLAGIFLISVGSFMMYTGKLFNNSIYTKLFLGLSVLATPIGFIAAISGWYVTELGRQPWVIYNIMRVKDAISPTLDYNLALISLITFAIIYTISLIIYFKYIIKMIKGGMDAYDVSYNPLNKDNSFSKSYIKSN